jgi:hypothetical protein
MVVPNGKATRFGFGGLLSPPLPVIKKRGQRLYERCPLIS